MWSAPLRVSRSGSYSLVPFRGGGGGIQVPNLASLLASGIKRRGVWTRAPVPFSLGSVWTHAPFWLWRGGLSTQGPSRMGSVAIMVVVWEHLDKGAA